jgi:hypothetical protein
MPRPTATTPNQEAVAVDTVLGCNDDQDGASQGEWQKQTKKKSLTAQAKSL